MSINKPEFEVRKVYESYPAYERIKNYVVDQIISLSSQATQIQTLLFLKRRDKFAINQFKANVLTFYQFLRPKMSDIISSYHKQQYIETMHILDFFIDHPLQFDISSAIITFNNLNQFCEDYKLTSTAFYAGYGTMKEKDVMNV